MFDAGFSELMVVTLVGLVVLGPERMLKVARVLGLLLGKARAAVADVRRQVELEVPMQDLQAAKREFEQVTSLPTRLSTSATRAATEIERQVGNG